MTVTNSVIYGDTGSVVDGTGNAVVQYTAADDDLSAFDTSNIYLDGLSAGYGDPFVVYGTRLLLDTASVCVDGGDDTLASTGFPDWATMTTRQDEALDTTPVDLGAHYPPETSLCLGDDDTGDYDSNGLCDDIDPPPAV